MDKLSFGQILRQTRERKGLDLNATARRLRIRPDILRAIEDSNFSAMPPRGYTRNMVNGYARYLGLNPTEITGMYLDELYAYQVDYASSRRRSTGFDMSEAPDNNQPLRRSSRRTVSQYSEDDTVSGRTGRMQATNRTHQARGSALPNTEYTNFYSGPNVDSGWRSKLPYIIAAAIALLLVIIIGSTLFGRNRDATDDSVPNVPVTGVSSETGTDVATSETEKAPTKFTFEYELDNGVESWVEVYIDGNREVAESQMGPVKNSYDISGTLQFICANPTGVTVKIDGEEQVVQADSDGIVNMTVSFADILAKWIANHPNSSEAKAAAGNASNAGSNTQGGTGTNAAPVTENQVDAQSDGEAQQYVEDTSYDEQSYDEGYSDEQYYDEDYEEPYYNEDEEY